MLACLCQQEHLPCYAPPYSPFSVCITDFCQGVQAFLVLLGAACLLEREAEQERDDERRHQLPCPFCLHNLPLFTHYYTSPPPHPPHRSTTSKAWVLLSGQRPSVVELLARRQPVLNRLNTLHARVLPHRLRRPAARPPPFSTHSHTTHKPTHRTLCAPVV